MVVKIIRKIKKVKIKETLKLIKMKIRFIKKEIVKILIAKW